MRRPFLILLILAFALTTTAFASDDESKAEVFGGYSFLRAGSGTDLPGLSTFNLHGWNASLSGFVHRNLGLTADFRGGYGSPEVLGLVSIKTRVHTFMGGPVLRVPTSKVTPFVHALFGGAHLSGEALGLSASDTAFAWATGGGVDVHLHRFFHIRVLQADFVQTRFSETSQNHAQISSGLVLTF
jgi:opacity protein-like surface antigen